MDRILLIDDDVELCDLLIEYISSEGFIVDSVQEGEEGIRHALSGKYTLAILDVMLPDMSGFDVLRRIRTKTRLPVLMLTARGNDIDRIVGLEIGADDYLPKPFNSRELVARIRAILRRAHPEADDPQLKTQAQLKITVGDIEINPATLEVFCQGEPVALTTVEFRVLEVLLRNAGVVVSREDLTKEVLGRSLSAYDRSIVVHVSNLRKKIGRKVRGVERIRSIRSAGYMYALHPDHTGEEKE